jgi:hypothetical protein
MPGISLIARNQDIANENAAELLETFLENDVFGYEPIRPFSTVDGVMHFVYNASLYWLKGMGRQPLLEQLELSEEDLRS